MGITATCDHCLPRSPYSGSIVSFTPGGGDLRLYATRIRAPVGLAFHDGELFVTMNQRNDLGQRTTGDALAVVAPGTDWRFPGCYQQGGAACAGVPPVIALLDRHAAVGPLVLTGERLSGVPGESALVSEWATGKVIRVALRSHDGDLSAASVSTWLTGARDPFALIGGPGGSLLVGDWATGTIYRIAPLR
jgi:glucose/arabinose dehydrogenase